MKVFKNRCYNGGKKHKFKPRYSEKEISQDIDVWGFTGEEIRRMKIRKEYVGDVCEWCGNSNKRLKI